MERDVSRDALKLAVVDVLDRDGHARASLPVWQWPITIGRAVGCDIVLDDPHAAAHHATLAETDGVLTLLAGETINGVRMTGGRIAACERAALPADGLFQVGTTQLRVRRATDLVGAEQRLADEPARSGPPLPVLLAVLGTGWAASHWLASDPGEKLSDYLPAVLVPVLLLAVWSGLWAVGSKLVRHRFDYRRHLRIAATYTIAAGLTGLVLPVAAYVLGWAWLSRISGIAAAAVIGAMMAAHLTVILPARRQLVAGIMAALFVTAVSLYLFRNYQVQDRLFDELYVTTLAPPALRLAPAVPASRFIEESRRLQPVLDHHARKDADEAP